MHHSIHSMFSPSAAPESNAVYHWTVEASSDRAFHLQEMLLIDSYCHKQWQYVILLPLPSSMDNAYKAWMKIEWRDPCELFHTVYRILPISWSSMFNFTEYIENPLLWGNKLQCYNRATITIQTIIICEFFFYAYQTNNGSKVIKGQ